MAYPKREDISDRGRYFLLKISGGRAHGPMDPKDTGINIFCAREGLPQALDRTMYTTDGILLLYPFEKIIVII